MATQKSPREQAARALCALHGHPADARMDGEPIWMSYLEEVDTVLKAALPSDVWKQIKGDPD